MSARMAEVIAAVLGATEERGNDIRRWPADEAEAYREAGGFFGGHQAARALWMGKVATHVAGELTKAGYGNVQEAQQDHVRTHTITVTETTAEGFNFEGCSDRNPDACACSSYVEVICQLCDEPICDGELIQTVTYPTIHSVDYDSMDQEWETDAWHTACVDPLAAALADPEGHALVRASRGRKAGA